MCQRGQDDFIGVQPCAKARCDIVICKECQEVYWRLHDLYKKRIAFKAAACFFILLSAVESHETP